MKKTPDDDLADFSFFFFPRKGDKGEQVVRRTGSEQRFQIQHFEKKKRKKGENGVDTQGKESR